MFTVSQILLLQQLDPLERVSIFGLMFYFLDLSSNMNPIWKIEFNTYPRSSYVENFLDLLVKWVIHELTWVHWGLTSCRKKNNRSSPWANPLDPMYRVSKPFQPPLLDASSVSLVLILFAILPQVQQWNLDYAPQEPKKNHAKQYSE